MTTDAAGEGKVSGNQASIPVEVREALEIEDGDILRWRVDEGGLEVEVVRRRDRGFEDFEPKASSRSSNVVEDHDAFGLEGAGDDPEGDDPPDP
jgi:bifunctional DNA-binding transcriptional regulator/antitoxin component of YhaV-PrlF toxin-antitoxin module